MWMYVCDYSDRFSLGLPSPCSSSPSTSPFSSQVTIGKGLKTRRVVRTMPNTPAVIRQGMTVWFPTEAVGKDDHALAQVRRGGAGRRERGEREERERARARACSEPRSVVHYPPGMYSVCPSMLTFGCLAYNRCGGCWGPSERSSKWRRRSSSTWPRRCLGLARCSTSSSWRLVEHHLY